MLSDDRIRTELTVTDSLSRTLGIDLKIKRDDLFPLSGGGSKARKACYISDMAIREGYNCIVTNGAIQSNHARAIALICAQLGMKCRLLIHYESEINESYISGNHLLMKLAGAEITIVDKADLSSAMNEAMESMKQRGYNPLYVWGGGHCYEGTLAYFEALLELASQLENIDWIPDYIVHASGTGTTQAGLVAGVSIVGWNTKVIGISIARERRRGTSVIEDALSDFCTRYGIPTPENAIDFRDNWLFGGYGKHSTGLLRAIEKAAKHGLILDPTYTGKAFFGLVNLVESGSIPEGSRVVFWHTGGLLNLMSSATLFSRR